jgi:predicted small lipoprotein YifL
VYATPGPDQGLQAAILPDRREDPVSRIARNRRSFLSLALVLTVSGLGTACGVKGPLYLPQETEKEKEKQKDKDEEKTSRGDYAPANATHS